MGAARDRWKTWGRAVGVTAGATVLTLLLRPFLAPVNLAMVYLLGVVAVASRSDRMTAAITALASVAAFDFFCVPPYLTFAVADPGYLITFAAMVIVAIIISTLTKRVRDQSKEAAAREARAQALYRLSNQLAGETQVFDTARLAATLAAETLASEVVIFLPDSDSISFHRRTSDRLTIPLSEQTIADWAFRHGRKAGLGVDDLLRATAQYVPLCGTRKVVGVMAVIPRDPELLDRRERELLTDLFANQTAMAIERTQSQNAAEASRVQMQAEQMRSSLLSAVSHDLLTPLASITGAASTMRLKGDRLNAQTRDELLESISDETERLSRLVRNLLDMTRLDTGGVELRRDAYPLEEIVGTSLHRLNALLKGREVAVEIPATLPLVFGDEVLLGQVFVNLIENALKYTPAGTSIEISACQTGESVLVQVRDHGPGLVPADRDHLFEKFYRGRGRAAQGTGLGLAISKAIIEAHGGRIEGDNHPTGGAVFRVYLPTQSLPLETHA